MQPHTGASVMSVNVGLPRAVAWEGGQVRRAEDSLSVARIYRLFARGAVGDRQLLRRAAELEALPEGLAGILRPALRACGAEAMRRRRGNEGPSGGKW